MGPARGREPVGPVERRPAPPARGRRTALPRQHADATNHPDAKRPLRKRSPESPTAPSAAPQLQLHEAAAAIARKDKGKGRGSRGPSPISRRPTAPVGAPRMPKNAVELIPVPRRRTVECEVFIFGTGEMGQLGLGEDCIQRKKPMPLRHLNAEEKIVDLAVGGMHTLALTNKGEIYSWGVNDNGALGREGDEDFPEKVEGLERVDVVSVAAGDSISCAISSKGRLYMWGSFRGANGMLGFTKENRGAQKVPLLMDYFLHLKIVQVAAGDDHVLALTSHGEVYAWGNGEQNQLGRRLIPRRMDASLVPENTGLRNIVRIGCGAFHSFAVSKERFVYSWGLNNFQQCGLEPNAGRHENIIFYPTIIGHQVLVGGDVQQCIGGNHFSLVRKGDGSIYAFGRSDENALGLPYTIDPDVPSPSSSPAGGTLAAQTPSPAADAMAVHNSSPAADSSAAQADSAPIASAFADSVPPPGALDNSFTMKVPAFLPPGTPSAAHIPLAKNKPSSKGKSAIGTPKHIPTLHGVVHIACGTSHSLAVTECGRCYAWGVGEQFQLANNEPVDIPQPVLVEGQKIADHRVVLTGAGATFSVILATPRALDSGDQPANPSATADLPMDTVD